METKLEALLHSAIGASPYSPGKIDEALEIQRAASGDQTALAQFRRLCEALRDSPFGAAFAGRHILVGYQTHILTIDKLVQWLLLRTRESTAAEAVANLLKFTQAERFDCYVFTVLAGLAVSEDLVINDDLSVKAWSTLPSNFKSDLIQQSFRDPVVQARSCIVQRVCVENTDASKHGGIASMIAGGMQVPGQDHPEIAICLGLTGPIAAQVLGTSVAVDPSIPLPPMYVMGPSEIRMRWECRELPTDHFEQARKVVNSYLRLSRTEQERIFVPMWRLNSAMLQHSPVNAAIDLGIAFESTFLLRNEPGGIAQRLRDRTSRYLGRSAAETQEIVEAVRDIYSLRCGAAHQGILEQLSGGRDPTSRLLQGYGYVAEALRRIIVEGQPNWSAI